LIADGVRRTRNGRKVPFCFGALRFGVATCAKFFPLVGHGPGIAAIVGVCVPVPNRAEDPGASKQDVEQAMQGHILARAELMGTYQR